MLYISFNNPYECGYIVLHLIAYHLIHFKYLQHLESAMEIGKNALNFVFTFLPYTLSRSIYVHVVVCRPCFTHRTASFIHVHDANSACQQFSNQHKYRNTCHFDSVEMQYIMCMRIYMYMIVCTAVHCALQDLQCACEDISQINLWI